MTAYADLLAFKRALGVPALDTLRDADYLRALEAASAEIDAETGRTFQPYLATKMYGEAVGTRTLRTDRALWIDDLLALTSLLVAGTTWTTDLYLLLPTDAPARRRPYTRLAPVGVWTMPTPPGVFALTGLWGYWSDLVAIGALGAALATTTATTLTMAAGSTITPGQTLIIGAEQMYVEALTGMVATVRRGVNGTVPATHLINAAVSRYAYPSVVSQATIALASSDFATHSRGGMTSKRAGDLAVTYGSGDAAVATRRGQFAPLGALRRRTILA